MINEYILSILGIIILLILVDIILPEGAVNSYIKNISSIFLVFVIIAPIINLFKTGFNINNWLNFPEYQLLEKELKKTYAQNYRYIEKDIEDFLEFNGYKGVDININFEVNNNQATIQSIYGNISNLVINKNVEHIDYYTEIKHLILSKVENYQGEVILYG